MEQRIVIFYYFFCLFCYVFLINSEVELLFTFFYRYISLILFQLSFFPSDSRIVEVIGFFCFFFGGNCTFSFHFSCNSWCYVFDRDLVCRGLVSDIFLEYLHSVVSKVHYNDCTFRWNTYTRRPIEFTRSLKKVKW